MELVLEQKEVVELVREALTARGMAIPEKSEVRLRRNNKKGTLRLVLVSDGSKSDEEREGSTNE